jgi:hypothetical protein
MRTGPRVSVHPHPVSSLVLVASTPPASKEDRMEQRSWDLQLGGVAVGQPLEPGTCPFPRRGDYEGGPVRVLPRHRVGARPAPAQPAVHDEALALRRRRRRVLPEAGAEGDAVLDPDARVPHVPARRWVTARDFPIVNSPEARLWMVQMCCIDMNAWYSRVDKPHRPDFVLFALLPPACSSCRSTWST